MVARSYFTKELFQFLKNLKRNNNREWFEDHRGNFEAFAKMPMVEFLKDFKAPFEKFAPKFICDPKPNGGSMFRIYRDMRFADPDEGPYKLHISAQFRHRRGKDVHAPGYYIHLEPGSCFFAGGLWRPPTGARNLVHDAIAKDPKAWLKIKHAKSFAPNFSDEEGEMLKKPSPAWREHFPTDAREDFMRKSFLFSMDLEQDLVTSVHFLPELVRMTRITAPFMDFLCCSV